MKPNNGIRINEMEEKNTREVPSKKTGGIERRLSEISLGKQLPLSQSAGLQLQWTVAL